MTLKYKDKTDECPNYIIKCPDCNPGETCVYPGYRNCPYAGIPTCKPNCDNVRCGIRDGPCPDECPFSCQYENNGCCLGEPTCSVCYTFAPCKVNPCPKECEHDCIYKDADFCCPYSGIPTCPYKSKDNCD
ncbi:unnamed protein product [Cunninghamella echinulata]